METVGQQLHEARLRLGLTLEDVSASTRINVAKVKAIECDDVSQFNSRFLYKSFVRQVGVAVRFREESLEESLSAAAAQIPEPAVPGELGAPGAPKVAGLKPQRIRISRWVYSVGSFAVILAACSGLFAVWQNSRTERAAQPRANTTVLKAMSSKPATPAPAEAPAASDLHIQMSASAPTWVSVTSDGKQVFSGILQTAETKVLEGHEIAKIRTGNAGGVQVVFNGHSIGALGTNGQVRTAVFSKNGYEILEPQARVDAPSL